MKYIINVSIGAFFVLFFLISLPHNVSAHHDQVQAINTYRAQFKLKPLVLNQQLEASAHESACQLKNGQRSWSHMGYVQAIRSHYKGGHVGENIAKQFPNFQATLNGWINSTNHRKNMLSKTYDEMGVGECGDVWVVHFGQKKIIKKISLVSYKTITADF